MISSDCFINNFPFLINEAAAHSDTRGMHMHTSHTHTQSFKETPAGHVSTKYMWGKIKLGNRDHSWILSMLSIHSLPLLFICESCHKSMSTDPLVFGRRGW